MSTAAPAALRPVVPRAEQAAEHRSKAHHLEEDPLTTPALTVARLAPSPTIVNPMTENSPKSPIVVTRACRSAISGTEKADVLGADAAGALADVDAADPRRG